jgi:hypothetical protein
MTPAFQGFELPGKVSNSVAELGGLSSATVVRDQGNNNGWRAHHQPPKQKQRYVFHQIWLGKYG